jgi:flagellar biosynthesis protein FlhF
MQVKKFEAPTIQEALENVKRELGPEAIILQTKKNKRGFGLMSKASVEITAAVSDRSLQKKQLVDTRMPEPNKEAIKKMPAEKQADFLDKYSGKYLNRYESASSPTASRSASAGASYAMDGHLEKAIRTQDRVDVARSTQPQSNNKKLTATRYIDIDDEPNTARTRAPALPPASTAMHRSPAASQAPQVQVQTKSATETNMPLVEELKHLKRMIEELKSAQENADEMRLNQKDQALYQRTILESPALQDVFEQLIVSGIDRRYALTLVKKVAFEIGPDASKKSDQVLDHLAGELMESVEVKSPLSQIQKDRTQKTGPSLVALIGPTGVGKTTTLAKIASEAILKKGLKVGLINLDNYKLTAFDQLATYAKILNVPFRSAGSIEDLKAALSDFKNLDLIMIDTTGRSQRDPDSLKEMHEILKSIPDLSTYIVLSATTRDSELYDAASRFSVFRPEGMIISKLDEATVYGGIYNVSQKVKIPLLYFTTGQKIPDDIEEASKERVASLIMDL